MASEEAKDAARNTLFGAASVVVTYGINLLLPQSVPVEVRGGIITIALAGLMYLVSYIDSRIHHDSTDRNGLIPW